ncbi:MAG TPA: DUF2282 domain-containing protein [Kiloniellales bacterium]|nr:DUF2282 domain-containing protein [Kiloniellales bacterium]
MNKLSVASLAAALLGAVSLATLSVPAQADEIKCFGIAKAGENDCANAAGTHSCKGQSAENYSGADWKVAASLFECHSMGGQTEPFEGMNPIMKS